MTCFTTFITLPIRMASHVLADPASPGTVLALPGRGGWHIPAARDGREPRVCWAQDETREHYAYCH